MDGSLLILFFWCYPSSLPTLIQVPLVHYSSPCNQFDFEVGTHGFIYQLLPIILLCIGILSCGGSHVLLMSCCKIDHLTKPFPIMEPPFTFLRVTNIKLGPSHVDWLVFFIMNLFYTPRIFSGDLLSGTFPSGGFSVDHILLLV